MEALEDAGVVAEAHNDENESPNENVHSFQMPGPGQTIDCGDGVLMPAMFFYCHDDADVHAIAAFWGYELKIVSLEADEGAADLLKAHLAGEYVLPRWNPPPIPAWEFVGRIPTGDVPVAMYITEAQEAPATEEPAEPPVPA